jgi:hypothetical protein
MLRLHGKSKHPRDGRRNRGGRRLRAGLENGCQPATSVDPCMSGTGQNENPSSTPPIPLAAVASAASGQMVAATPSRVMNSRRLMADPVDDHKLPHCATQQNWLSMAEMVNRVDFPSPRYFRSPSESGARADMAALTLGAKSGCEQSQQGSPYSITSSARAASMGGTSRPSVLAALRLMMSVNLVGCSIGRSPALVPLRILSV